MLTALKGNSNRQAVSAVSTLPAPVGGLNARDPLSGMDPTDAVQMDNIFPEANYATLRRGYSSYATGMSGAIQSLLTYHALNGSEQMWAGVNNTLANVTNSGSVSSVYSTSITVNKWQYINFSNSAGLYILAVNGTDLPRRYNGTNWSVNSITGSVASSAKTMINIFQHKERVWLVEKNTLNLWYLASQAISGTATKLPLGGVFNNGGQILAGGTLSINDSGDGMDDLLVAVTDQGEVAVYNGTNPASDFGLIGVYKIGQPIGNRCLVKIAGDLVIITTQGAVPLSTMIHNDKALSDRVAITSKVQETFNADARNYKSNFGWEGIVYPKGRMALFNVPIVAGSVQNQYVQNVITGAWCRFTGWNANCFGILNGELYFGGNSGVVYKADTGGTDGGGQIEAELHQAFSYCGSKGQNKFFKFAKPLLVTSGVTTLSVGLNVDFEQGSPNSTLAVGAGTVATWGTGTWGTALWGGGIVSKKWASGGKLGEAVSTLLHISSTGVTVQINGWSVLYEKCKGTIF